MRKCLLIFLTSCLLDPVISAQPGQDLSGMLKALNEAKDSLKPRIYSRIGFYYYSRDKFDSALYYINESLSLSKRLNIQTEVGHAYNNIGSLYRLRSDFATAFVYYQQALEVYDQIGDDLGAAKVYGNMAVAYGEQMQIEKSNELNKQSVSRFKKARDTFSLITCYINLVNGHSILNDFTQSRKYLDSAQLLFQTKMNAGTQSQEDAEHAAFVSLFLNKTHALQLHNEKKFDSSILLYKNAIRTSYAMGSLNLVDMMKGLSESYIETKQYDSALVYMNTALGLLKKDSVAEGYKDVYRTLSVIYEKQGRDKEALEAFKLYKEFNDSITNSNNYKTIANLNAIHETKKKDEQIVQFGKERKAQNMIIILAAAGALVAVGLMIFAFRSRKLQKRLFLHKEELLFKEKEIETTRLKSRMTELEQMALRAQMNPHFIFNSLNSVQHFVMNKDMEAVNRYLGAFAHLVRQTLNNSGKPLITLDEEIKYLDTYLSLEKMKSNDRFNYKINVSEDIDRYNTFIPGMIIQPFVENSIKHGVTPKTSNDGDIQVEFYKNGKLFCRIVDNGIGREKAETIKTAVADPVYESRGMDITYQRLEAINKMFGSSISVKVEDKEDSSGDPAGTLVEIAFPTDLE